MRRPPNRLPDPFPIPKKSAPINPITLAIVLDDEILAT
jgi:hypothetical protein